MNKAYFRNIQKEILNKLDKAHTSVYLAVAWFTDHILFDKLLELLQEGIEIKVVLNDDDINNSNRERLLNIVQYGGEVYLFPVDDVLMHQKFCIIDSSILITGSYNWTRKAATANSENIFILTGLDAPIQQFKEEFNALLKQSKSLAEEEEKLDLPENIFDALINKLENSPIYLKSFNPHILPIIQNGRYGLVDNEGNLILPCIFEYCSVPLERATYCIKKNRLILITGCGSVTAFREDFDLLALGSEYAILYDGNKQWLFDLASTNFVELDFQLIVSNHLHVSQFIISILACTYEGNRLTNFKFKELSKKIIKYIDVQNIDDGLEYVMEKQQIPEPLKDWLYVLEDEYFYPKGYYKNSDGSMSFRLDGVFGYPFTDGYAKVKKSVASFEEVSAIFNAQQCVNSVNGRDIYIYYLYGLIDKQGTLVIHPEFIDIEYIGSNIAKVVDLDRKTRFIEIREKDEFTSYVSDEELKYVMISNLIPKKLEELLDVFDDDIFFPKGYYEDKKGNILFKIDGIIGYPFKNGFARIKKSLYKFEKVEELTNALHSVNSVNGTLIYIYRLYNLIDLNGNILLSTDCLAVEDFRFGYSKVVDLKKREYYVDETGGRIPVDPTFSRPLNEKYFLFERDGRKGLVSKNNRQILPCEFDVIISDFNDNVLVMNDDDKPLKAVITKGGTLLTDEFDL